MKTFLLFLLLLAGSPIHAQKPWEGHYKSFLTLLYPNILSSERQPYRKTIDVELLSLDSVRYVVLRSDSSTLVMRVESETVTEAYRSLLVSRGEERGYMRLFFQDGALTELAISEDAYHYILSITPLLSL